MCRNRRVVLLGVVALAGAALAVAGERMAGEVCLECESLNACGASFSSAEGVELGWTIGQHGLHCCAADSAGGDLGLQSGLWTESQTQFAGTLFLFQ